ncbi:hypothetical protein LPJ57_001590 [Coemansia sp. RSA 486]|nr:hypothetical protein LPJ57_001590 [Coemansia sp. RSA 486]
MEFLAHIHQSRFSNEFVQSLKEILETCCVLSCIERAVETSHYCEQKKYMSIAYEVRVNTVEADGHWYHRCLTESNHHLWRWQKQRLYRKNIFPSAPVDYSNAQGKSTFGPIKVFDGLYDPQSVEIRLFNLQYVGWVPNLRTEYYKEVVARQSLTQIQVPAVAEYLGCVVENGLIIGVALRKPKCSFEYALSQNMPCAEMHSKDLVDTVAVMQRHGMVKSPIRPSAVALDTYNRLVLVGVDCMFSSSWCGGTKLLLTPETSQKELAYSLAKTNPLGPVFARLCARIQSFGYDQHKSHASIVTNSCNRSTCHYDYLNDHVLTARPHCFHTLHVPEPQVLDPQVSSVFSLKSKCLKLIK